MMTGFIKKPPSELQLRRQRHKAACVLGFERGETYDAAKVRTRFAELVKQAHPDSNGGQPVVEGLDDIRKAKDLLLRHLEKDNGHN